MFINIICFLRFAFLLFIFCITTKRVQVYSAVIATSEDINTTELTKFDCSSSMQENNLSNNDCDIYDLNTSLLSAINTNPNSNLSTTVERNSVMTISGIANATKTADDGNIKFVTNLNVTTETNTVCPSLDDAEYLTQTQLINRLTAPCRFDRLERPLAEVNGTLKADYPLQVHVRAYIYVLQVLDSSDLQFKMQGLIQIRYTDPRLAFGAVAPNRRQAILGETQLRKLIWVPHIFLANEHDSSVLGTSEQDILTSISPNGTVIISSRVQATLFCWMDLKKFPFDEQQCSTVLESWMYNSSELMLHWESNSPVTFDPKMHLTEYTLQYAWSNETIINADLNDLRHGAFAGNYSSLSFTVHLTREVGYYVMDYFLPSMMIVAISWVSFWLQADQTPARTTLGTSTMLSFITLASSQENNLPKVSYIKVSEVWFLGCTLFIFGSLVEFAFVNTIWRRNRHIELKKVNSKYILKSTLTPRLINRKILNTNDSALGSSKGSINFLNVETPIIITTTNPNDFSTTIDYSSQSSVSTDENNSQCTTTNNNIGDDSNNNDDDKNKKTENTSWSTMSPHEVSLWIDRKARFVFPLAFLIFNALFWTFVYCL